MDNRPNNKNTKYILLFLLVLVTGVGIWKCTNLSDKESHPELAKEKEDNLEVATSGQSNVPIEEDKVPPTKNELKTPKKEDKVIPPKSENEESLEIKIEESSKSEDIIPREEFSKKDIIVSHADKNIDLRPAASSTVACTTTNLLKIAKSSIQTSVAFSPDGATFAVGNHNNYVSVMNMKGEELLKLIGHKGYVQSVKYSSDGKFIATGGVDHTAKLWDANNGKELKSFEGHTEGILCVAYSRNGKYIATGSLDHTTILWDTKSGNKIFQLKGHQSEIAEVIFSNDSRFLITGSSDRTAKVWDVKTGEILYSLEGHDGVVSGVAITPDDELIVTGSVKKIRLWNAKTGKHIHTINGNKDSVMSIFVSPDGKYITSSSVNGSIKIWKIKGGKEVCKLEGHTTRSREAVFHPTESNTIVSAANDQTIRIWKFELN